MADVHSKAQRSFNMSRIRGKNTKPEMRVRSLLHRMGFRFRLHRKDLPGKPDIVLPAYGTVIFVHGCFWHRHPGCHRTTTPKTRVEFWSEKFQANVARDALMVAELEALGWTVLVVWECQTRSSPELRKALSCLFWQRSHQG